MKLLLSINILFLFVYLFIALQKQNIEFTLPLLFC